MQEEFKGIMKEIHSLMKTQKFRKKGRNFYKKLDGYGLVMNVQKSAYNSYNSIKFTINLGIFVPEYWSEKHNSTDIPAFPNEIACVYRDRIGRLTPNPRDRWYVIDDAEDAIKDIENHLLPFFKKISVKDQMLDFIESTELHFAPLGKLILFCENNKLEKVKAEYSKMLEKFKKGEIRNQIIAYGEKHNLV